ncbi:MAG: hypothetical protein KDA86_24685 [Planctomycetaceae bacterium]|nr:hypothetical protein [Planctomycetaceae bacterium]
MAERRTLVEGLKDTPPPIDPKAEKSFVYQEKEKSAPPPSTVSPLSRTPLSTKLREDFAKALKRASLERQLHGQEPHTLQDILEEAIEPWLKSNGYLP